MKLTIQVPGPLVISGEWTLLDPDRSMLVAGFDRYTYCEFEATDAIVINMPDLKLNNIHAEYKDGHFNWLDLPEERTRDGAVVKLAVETALQFLAEDSKPAPNFSMLTDTIEHTLTLTDGAIGKIGHETPAAVIVSIMAAFLKFSGYDLADDKTLDTIFKLATLTYAMYTNHTITGYETAASTFGGLLRYTPFDRAWLKAKIEAHSPLKTILAETWPLLKIEKIKFPSTFQITAAWFGNELQTVDAQAKIAAFKTAQPDIYAQLSAMIFATTEKIQQALLEEHQTYMLQLVEANQIALTKLAELAGFAIDIPKVKALTDIARKHNGAAKIAGGTKLNCGIAICFDPFVKEDIEWEWEEAGLYPLDVFISSKGASIWY